MLSYNLSCIGLEDLIQKIVLDYYPKVATGKDDILLYCEHPNTLSLGKNFKGFSRAELTQEEWRKRGFQVVQCDRGGQATVHVPGHLMIYPVINLKPKKLGVKNFIEILLGTIQASLGELGLDTFVDSKKLGLWVNMGELGNFKIVSLGLRVDRGITRHGASLYVDGDMEPFEWFSPCGDQMTRTISLKNIHENSHLLPKGMDFSALKYILMERITNNLESALENI